MSVQVTSRSHEDTGVCESLAYHAPDTMLYVQISFLGRYKSKNSWIREFLSVKDNKMLGSVLNVFIDRRVCLSMYSLCIRPTNT